MEPLKVHPIAAIFPEMSGAQFAELVADIQQNGLREPVLLHPDGSIIDGRNRYRACLEAGIEPTFRTWDEQGSLITLVLSLNLHRRHLDEGQRAMVGAKVKPLFTEEARQRQATSGPGIHGGKPLSANLRGAVVPGKAADKAASVVNVSPRLVEMATKVINSGTPELVTAIDRGAVSVSAAADLLELPAKEQRAVLDKGQKQVRAKVLEIRRRRRLLTAAKRGCPQPVLGRYASPEEILSSRLVELIARYEMKSEERVEGIEIARDYERGPIASIRIIHESPAANRLVGAG
jgi:hypothetical protein